MHILFITSAHNSLSQRLYVELTGCGHRVTVAVVDQAPPLHEPAMLEAARQARPELVIAPMLKRALPEALWRRLPCLVVHPGIVGDRGPSSLDWALTEAVPRWGVTLLQAQAEMDAGPIWATQEFEMPARPFPKASLYRHEVTEAAVRATLLAVQRFASGRHLPTPLDPAQPEVRGRLRPPMTTADRAIDWRRDDSATIVRRIRAADSAPGVLDTHFGEPLRLFGAHEEDRLHGRPGELIAQRQGAVCVGTTDGAVWITHLKAARPHAVKLPAARVLAARLGGVPESPLAPDAPADHRSHREIRYREHAGVGWLHFDFLNGAMNAEQCRRLQAAFVAARLRPTSVIVLMGGRDFFGNGIDLNAIEAAASPANESWRNILAIDELVREIIQTTSHRVLAALRGNAGAGGAMLALAADEVHARRGVVLNPHYRGMGGLYGSEYWTYLLPRRVGQDAAQALTTECQPLGTAVAQAIGFVDQAYGSSVADFDAELARHAQALAADPGLWNLLKDKHRIRLRDEARKPLAAYRQEELERMRVNFFGPDPAYHEARARFVHKGSPPAQPARQAAG